MAEEITLTDVTVTRVDLTGTDVSFLIGLPSVKAKVLGVTGNQYVLLHTYTTQDPRGNWYDVENYYIRDRWFIEHYWLDTL